MEKNITTEDTGMHREHLDLMTAGDENQLEADAALVFAGVGVVASSGAETPSIWGPGVVTGDAGIPLM